MNAFANTEQLLVVGVEGKSLLNVRVGSPVTSAEKETSRQDTVPR